MDTFICPFVKRAHSFQGSVIVEFADGRDVLYPAELLNELRSRAVTLRPDETEITQQADTDLTATICFLKADSVRS